MHQQIEPPQHQPQSSKPNNGNISSLLTFDFNKEELQNNEKISNYEQQIDNRSQLKQDVRPDLEHEELSQNEKRHQIEENMKVLQKYWEYRYTRLVDYAIQTNNWFKLFSFVSQFKLKSIELVKEIVHKGLQNMKSIDEIDYRYNLKNQGEDGIFLIDGIIVRLARIKKKKQNKKVFDYNAVKALHQQLLSHNILNNLSISFVKDNPNMPRIRVPLTCLVKYMGYTALCQADAPCEGLETLVHGPTGTIYQYRQQYLEMLKQIGKCLNLKEFSMVTNDRKSVAIPFSLTVELHKIEKYIPSQKILSIIHPDSILYPQNGSIKLSYPEYYLMNISKLWPLFIDSDIIKSVGYLRPQVVISFKKPLSNVVFCQVSEKADPEGELELADACKKVKEDHIASLAKILDNTTVFIGDSQGIEDIMHEYGINIRYMGALAERVNLQFNKKVLQMQMIARACKRYFFKSFHDEMTEQNLSGRELIAYFKQCFIEFLNILFLRSKESEGFYKNSIYKEIERYYDYQLKSYPPDVQGGGLLHAICFHFGVKIKIIEYPFFQKLQSIFNIAHIIEVHGSAKSYDFDTTEIKQVCKHYKEKRRANKLDQCIKQLKIISKIHSFLNIQATEPIGTLPQAYFQTQLSEVYFKVKDYEKACFYAQLALNSIPEKHSDAIRPLQILLKYHSMRKENNKSVEYYEKSLNYLGYHLGLNHPMTIEVYNSYAYELLEEETDANKCEKMFLRSLEICERSLGYSHSTSSQILLQLAELPLSIQKKITYYLQGLNVLQNLDHNEQHIQKAKMTCMKLSEMYKKMGNIEKMIQYAKKCNYWETQIEGETKLNSYKNVLRITNRVPKNFQQANLLISYCITAYINLLSGNSKGNIYKLFVSLKEKITDVNHDKAVNIITQKLKIDSSNSMTVTEFVRNNINIVTQDLPSLILKPKFYKNLFSEIDPDDKKLRQAIEVFIEFMALVGIENSEKLLTEPKKIY